jgi:hypothetical protein
MPKVVVKLTEQVLQIKKSKAVLTVNVSLEATGKGESALSTTPLPSEIVFFTRSAPKATPTELATLSSTAVKSGKLASFDLNAASFTSKLTDKDTDNSVVLTFDKNTFKHPSGGDLTFKLRLPERPEAFSIRGAGAPGDVSVGKFELGASFSIGGQVEGEAFKDVAHVHLRHEKVQDDTETDRENLLIGATLAHPTDFASSLALMSQQASGAGEFSPALELKRLRPVHEQVLKHHYG